MIVADARQRRSPRRLPGARMKRAATSDTVSTAARGTQRRLSVQRASKLCLLLDLLVLEYSVEHIL